MKTSILTFFLAYLTAYTVQCDPPTCTADINCDGVVGTNDLLAILEAWGLHDGGDLSGNGATGVDDLNILLSHYGTICAEIND